MQLRNYLQPHPGKGGLGSLPQPPPLPLQQQTRTRSRGSKQPQPQSLSSILFTQPQPPQHTIKSMISNQRLQLSLRKPKQFMMFLLAFFCYRYILRKKRKVCYTAFGDLGGARICLTLRRRLMRIIIIKKALKKFDFSF